MLKFQRLIFDADNTLFDFNRAEAAALINSLQHFDLPTPAGLLEFYRRTNVKLWQQLDNRSITIDQLKQQRTAQLFEFIGQAAAPESFSSYYLDQLAVQQQLLPQVETTLLELAKHCEMAIITNGLARVQKPRLSSSSIAQHFGALVISEELGVAKPDAAIFAHTCELMGWEEPGEVLMVGDNYRCDIQGAANYGMRTCWYNLHQQPQPLNDHDFEIHHFAELLQHL